MFLLLLGLLASPAAASFSCASPEEGSPAWTVASPSNGAACLENMTVLNGFINVFGGAASNTGFQCVNFVGIQTPDAANCPGFVDTLNLNLNDLVNNSPFACQNNSETGGTAAGVLVLNSTTITSQVDCDFAVNILNQLVFICDDSEPTGGGYYSQRAANHVALGETGWQCEPYTVCRVGASYETAAPSYTSDRACTACTDCSETQYQSVAPTETSDRTCSTLTQCELGVTYANVVATATSDTTCVDIGPRCIDGTTYQSRAATLTSDRLCVSCSACPAGAVARYDCTEFSNTVCETPGGTLLTFSPTTAADAITGPGTDRGSGGGGSGTEVKTEEQPISTFDQFMIVLAVVVGLVVVGFVVASFKDRKLDVTQKELEGRELLLHDAEQNVARLLKAWQIPEEDVQWGKTIAEGSFGTVRTGRWGGQRVAIKLLKRPLDDDDPTAAEDFNRECETLQTIRHPHLLIFFGAGKTRTQKPFMITEFMVRGSLRTVLQTGTAFELSWDVRHRMATQIAKGMEYLHMLGIVHRDLKSDNCLCDVELNAKVADFGNSRLLTLKQPHISSGDPGSEYSLQSGTADHDSSQDLGETSFGSGIGGGAGMSPMSPQSRARLPTMTMTKGVGTPLWMAPELMSGGNRYGPEVDLYSFAVIMWELAFRRQPWDELPECKSVMTFFRYLAEALADGRRPSVEASFAEAHPEYVAMMHRCWHDAPGERPVMQDVVLFFTESGRQWGAV